MTQITGHAHTTDFTHHLAANPDAQAFWLLRIGFTVAPLIAGMDKFLHLLTDWDKYVAPWVTRIVGNAHNFMLVAGVVEIVAGIGVAIWPRIFGWVVAAWLLGIIVNLLALPQYYDIALRDLGLAIGAASLALLSQRRQRPVTTP